MWQPKVSAVPDPFQICLGRDRIYRVVLSITLFLGLLCPPARSDDSASGSLPVSADLRPLLEQYGFTPCEQGARNTCSVFTMRGALEFAVAKRQGHCPRLSVEFLNWAANKACGNNKDGGFFSEMWKGFSAYGICLDDDLPYQPEFNPSLTPPPPALADAKTRLGLGLRLHWIKEWDVKTGLTDVQVASIKHILSTGWPVAGGFRWPKEPRWIDDVLQLCSADAVRDGHSVLLVGYRDDAAQPGGGAFIFRNTSGPGRDGLMPYAYARDYLNDAVWIDYEARPKTVSGAGTRTPVMGDPLGALTTLPAGRNRRISSNEQPAWNDANMDMTILPPGKSLEMPLLQGPGVITHIWMTSHAGRVNELNALSLRVYWDEAKEPAIETPLGEFFAVGQGTPASVESVPVQVSPTGALSCYWRMPFAKSARIVVRNDNPNRTTGLYWQVDYVELDSLPEDTPRFYAHYRQEYPAVLGRDYVVADLEGRGSYVGTVIGVTEAQDGWWGEGDDFFYIDGESVPSLQGTGSEDYFNDAWGFRVRTSHWFGQPRWQGEFAGDSGVAYRWHVLDPVGFTKSLKVAFEHKGNCDDEIKGFFIERPDFISSVAFWYQLGEPKTFAEMPSYPERCVPWQTTYLVSTFRRAKVSGPAKPLVAFSGMMGARPILRWPNTKPGARMTVPFSVAQEGRYAVRIMAEAAPDYGVCDLELDGSVALPGADFRAADYQELDLSLRTHFFKAGPHELSFRAVAVNGKQARPIAVELLKLLPLPPEATRVVKNHNEAHFIRLGIGRAVYAYRLAYGVLPGSLNTLVKAGLMSARYLADENNIPLLAHREGDYLVVESKGPEGWTWRWQGLDARR
ncbi:hypothetical protein SBV1_2660005 [Verrucomicrobia bacterium]|nr:hypothetical protein SBV1_2660005 [Verrucomicrobiota bacterium]